MGPGRGYPSRASARWTVAGQPHTSPALAATAVLTLVVGMLISAAACRQVPSNQFRSIDMDLTGALLTGRRPPG